MSVLGHTMQCANPTCAAEKIVLGSRDDDERRRLAAQSAGWTRSVEVPGEFECERCSA